MKAKLVKESLNENNQDDYLRTLVHTDIKNGMEQRGYETWPNPDNMAGGLITVKEEKRRFGRNETLVQANFDIAARDKSLMYVHIYGPKGDIEEEIEIEQNLFGGTKEDILNTIFDMVDSVE